MTKPWKEFKEEIVRLYIQEGRTLQEVMAIMNQKHGFQASVRAYRQHFDAWNVGKYNCKRRQERRDSFSQPNNLPSPPGSPMLAPRMTMFPDDAGSEPSARLLGRDAARDNAGYQLTARQEHLQGAGMPCVPPHHPHAQPATEHTQQQRLRASMPLNCWNGAGQPPRSWTQDVYFAPRKNTRPQPVEDIARYSPEQSPFSPSTGQMSPTYLEQPRPPMYSDIGWNVSRPGAPSHRIDLSPSVQQHQDRRVPEPDRKARPETFLHASTRAPILATQNCSPAARFASKRPDFDGNATHQSTSLVEFA